MCYQVTVRSLLASCQVLQLQDARKHRCENGQAEVGRLSLGDLPGLRDQLAAKHLPAAKQTGARIRTCLQEPRSRSRQASPAKGERTLADVALF